MVSLSRPVKKRWYLSQVQLDLAGLDTMMTRSLVPFVAVDLLELEIRGQGTYTGERQSSRISTIADAKKTRGKA